MIKRIEREAKRAGARFGPFHSSHEGLGVLREEYLELEDAIRANDGTAIRRESIQIAAVALRLAEATATPEFKERSLIGATGKFYRPTAEVSQLK